MNRRSIIAGLAAYPAAISGAALLGCDDGWAAEAVMPDDRFEMPLESAAHERTFMQWPVSAALYGAKFLNQVQGKIALIANTISRFEPVVMLAGPGAVQGSQAQLNGNVDIWDIPTDDLWCRDSGPTFVRTAGGKPAIAHIAFNGWGNKQPHANDAAIAKRIAEKLNLPLLATGLVGEQGGVEHDGAGTLLAHASCWVNPNRNRGSQAEIGVKLLKALGGRKIIWAPGIQGADITDYHIDALARFVGPGRVLIQLPKRMNPRDPWSKAAYETYEILKRATDANGRNLEIVIVHEPEKMRVQAPDFVASYVNYYVCNGGLISAEFGDATADQAAHDLLKSLYPEREIVALNVDPIGKAGGGIHCATQQMPKLPV